MMRETGSSIFSGFVLLSSLAVPVFAQNDACRYRTLPITVVESHGLPVQGLVPADFQAKFRGNPVQILSVSRDTHPRRVAILLDVSGSMLQAQESDKWMIVREVAGDAVLHLPTDIQIALELFDEKIVETLDFGSGRQAVARRIVALAGGTKAVQSQSKSRTTALWDSLLNAVSIFGSPQPGDAVYLITDGGDNMSKIRPGQIEDSFLGKGIRLFAFLVVSGLMPDEEQGLDVVKRLTKSTGGNYMVLFGVRPLVGQPNFRMSEEQKAGLAYSAQVLYAQMKEFSWLGVSLPSPVDKTRDWNLDLNRASNKSHKDLRLFYPHKLIPCDEVPSQLNRSLPATLLPHLEHGPTSPPS
jgi:hypothetical protein